MSTTLRLELALAFAVSALVVWIIVVPPSCLLACPMFAEPPEVMSAGDLVALSLLALGWALIARLLYGARRPT